MAIKRPCKATVMLLMFNLELSKGRATRPGP
ncbi:hypothetical protein CCACVL1_30812 [Corchorus capsularis]|uniref:Uncharacterized protein n=1 Tax=Corchorus capsularis TaxID=210143 RepID=A0A1R3FVA1_COCAP|nr:hypothetical protein CCACVL1_30812 [Corchorus capsularis]